jgi:diacylglycerol kinase (CTP)
MSASDTTANTAPTFSSTTRRRRPSLTPPTLPKRSPSPIIAFAASTLPGETKGVKDITQQVIRSLERLGHIDFLDAQGRMVSIDEQAEAVLDDGNGLRLTKPENGKAVHRQKIDWEIPRKALHSSIGMLHRSLLLPSQSSCPE